MNDVCFGTHIVSDFNILYYMLVGRDINSNIFCWISPVEIFRNINNNKILMIIIIMIIIITILITIILLLLLLLLLLLIIIEKKQ